MCPPSLSFALTIRVDVGAPIEIGQVAGGRRRIVPILGGTFEGEDLRGRVLPGGADRQLIRPDGVAELDARYTLQTDRGSHIDIRNIGVRHAPANVAARLIEGQPVDPSLVYFKTSPRFETAAPELQWLTRTLFVATGERHPSTVVLFIWKVE